MKTGTALVPTLFVLAGFTLVGQQPATNQPNSPATQQSAPGMAQAPADVPETAAVTMSPVSGELLSKLDTKTAKTGDSVVVQTKTSVKTADGTEIPKGSKLVGHVIAVHPSAAGDNSQMALQFDHLELKGGQNVAVRSQIESIAPAGGGSTNASGAMSVPQAGGSSSPSMSGTNGGSSRANGAPQGTSDTGTTPPAAGTVVARTGNIAIATTSVPGVLLANNAPGQQDPRMAKTSSILLGAKQDIQLDGGTQMVVGVSASGGGMQ